MADSTQAAPHASGKKPTLKALSQKILNMVAPQIAGAVAVGMDALEKRLNARIDALEKQLEARSYKGIWKEGLYQKENLVTLGGSVWIAKSDTSSRPGTDGTWQLAVKKGRDGRGR